MSVPEGSLGATSQRGRDFRPGHPEKDRLLTEHRPRRTHSAYFYHDFSLLVRESEWFVWVFKIV